MYNTLTNALGCVTMYLKKGDNSKMQSRRLTDIESEWCEIIESDKVTEAINQISCICAYAVSTEDIAKALKRTYLSLKILDNNYRKMYGFPMRRRLTKTKRLPKQTKIRDRRGK